MFCKYCGKQLNDESNFCKYCGKTIKIVSDGESIKVASEQNDKNVSVSENKPKERPANKWFAGYIIAGLIWVFSQSFNKSTADIFVITIIAIVSGFFYHRLKARIKIKNETVKIIITSSILLIVAAFLVGASTTLF